SGCFRSPRMCRSPAIPIATSPTSARPIISTCSMSWTGWATRAMSAWSTSPRPPPRPALAGRQSTASRPEPMADPNTPAAAFTGLGWMGLGRAGTVWNQGHKGRGVDPGPPACEPSPAVGGAVGATPAEAAADADAVVVAVVNAEQVESVLYGAGGAVA